jgi:F5/8 type C domain/Polysaccharide lyase
MRLSIDGRKLSPWLGLAALLLAAAPAGADIIWDGDASKGTGVFSLIGQGNCLAPSSITAVDDPVHGRVWRYHKPAETNRCENHGFRVDGSERRATEGETWYLGWWSKLSSTANNNANFQWKSYGSHIQNFPLVLKMINGQMTLMQRQPEGVTTFLWRRTLSANQWNHFVLGIHVSSGLRGGWVELWFNGVKQTFTTGGTRFACRTLDSGDHNCPKWGVYGGSGQAMTNWVDGLKVGTTPEDVMDGGGGGGGSTKLAVAAVSASSADGANVAGNTLDRSLATRWSANGDRQWIRFDLGASRTVDLVKIAWYKGDARAASFDIEVSAGPDGPWLPLLTGGQSSAGTTALETYDFTDGAGRYLRILGHGNSVNDWNSLTEVEVWGR